jgi:hypothetical protein
MATLALPTSNAVESNPSNRHASELPTRPGPNAGPRLAFDVCQDYYVEARETLVGKINITKIDSPINKIPWKPQVRPRLTDYCADYARAGRAALAAPHLSSRLIMFSVYYLGLAPYEKAREHLGICEMTWVNWSEEIRNLVGRELLDRRIFPPSRYMRPGPLSKSNR